MHIDKKELEDAAKLKDWQKIKGASLYCAARRLEKVCEEVQKNHSIDKISDTETNLYSQLIYEIDAVTEFPKNIENFKLTAKLTTKWVTVTGSLNHYK